MHPEKQEKTRTPRPSADLEAWLAGPYAQARAASPERRKTFATTSGIEIEPLYPPAEPAAPASLGFPGTFPFTRGAYPTMYRGRPWTMRQYAGFSSASETNGRFRSLLASGQTGLSVAFDLPTQIGYDSDHPLARDEAGLVGVPINGLKDVERLFDSIPLGEVSTSMTINATACVLLALYCALARKQGVPLERLRGTVQNDILKEYAARGNYRFPPGPSMRLATDLVAWCAKEVPSWNTISISGYHIREAGSSAVQELAFTLSNGRAYVRAALAAGLAIDDFAPRLSFFFNAHNHLFEEVAKFRRFGARGRVQRRAGSRPEPSGQAHLSSPAHDRFRAHGSQNAGRWPGISARSERQSRLDVRRGLRGVGRLGRHRLPSPRYASREPGAVVHARLAHVRALGHPPAGRLIAVNSSPRSVPPHRRTHRPGDWHAARP
jgi:hypothetical protein